MNGNRTRKTSRLPMIALASLPLTLGLAFAQQSGASTTTDPTAQVQRVQPAQSGQNQTRSGTQTRPGRTQPGQPRQNSGTNYADVYLQKLATQLGTTVAKLKAAAVAAGGATIDQGVKAGDFPADRAAGMKQRLQQHPFAFGRAHGGPGMGRDGGPGRGGPRGPHQHDQNGNDVMGGDRSGGVTVPQTSAQTGGGT